MQYYFNIDVKWSHACSASSKKQALQIVKDNFNQDYGLELDNDEIKYIGKEKK